MNDLIQQAAARLRTAEETQTPCPPIRDLIGPSDEVAAYAIQNIGTERKLAGGRKLVGRKIGLTNPVVQQQLGVDQPDFGMLFDDMQASETDVIPYRKIMQPKIEAEIAFILAASLTKAKHSIDDVVAATKSVVVAFEIVGSRIAGWDIKFADTVADNASSGMFVLGAKELTITSVDLVGCAMRMTRGGEEVSKGSGAACMGNPLNAAVWLADKMAASGRPLQAGDIILSGALGPMVAVNPGDKFIATVDGFGSVSATFGA
jgi:2-keto-4-pentenoate hydratase